jgi:hypothetical protein
VIVGEVPTMRAYVDTVTDIGGVPFTVELVGA